MEEGVSRRFLLLRNFFLIVYSMYNVALSLILGVLLSYVFPIPLLSPITVMISVPIIIFLVLIILGIILGSYLERLLLKRELKRKPTRFYYLEPIYFDYSFLVIPAQTIVSIILANFCTFIDSSLFISSVLIATGVVFLLNKTFLFALTEAALFPKTRGSIFPSFALKGISTKALAILYFVLFWFYFVSIVLVLTMPLQWYQYAFIAFFPFLSRIAHEIFEFIRTFLPPLFKPLKLLSLILFLLGVFSVLVPWENILVDRVMGSVSLALGLIMGVGSITVSGDGG